MNGRVALDVHQLGHGDRTGLAHAAEVVPDEVDDHEVLGHVLLTLGEVGGKDEVFGRSLAPRKSIWICRIGCAWKAEEEECG